MREATLHEPKISGSSDSSDDELIEQIRQGSERAFALLVRRYQHRVFHLIYRFVHNAQDTEDLAQEIFFNLYNSLPKFRGECSIFTWIHRITVNRCINFIKSKPMRRPRTEAFEDIHETKIQASPLSPSLANPEEQMIGRQTERRLQTAIQKLDEEYRVVLILRDVEHLAYEEIAEITDLPLGTVKSRLHRARGMLLSFLEGEE